MTDFATTATIKERQNDDEALGRLLAQRRLYAAAKRWSMLHDVGLAVVAVAAPLLAAFVPDATVAAGAIAGGWIFLSRTVFNWLDRWYSTRGAVVQEMFDSYVFGLRNLAPRSIHVSPEDINRRIGRRPIREQAREEDLLNWYPLDDSIDGVAAIAIAQRSNAAYAERLQYLNASRWLAGTVVWVAITVTIALIKDLSLASFLIGVALPVLPVLLDMFEQWRSVRQASADRRALAAQIESIIKSPSAGFELPMNIPLWQDQLFTLRRDAPQIPNLLYKATRSANESTMKKIAAQMAANYKRRLD